MCKRKLKQVITAIAVLVAAVNPLVGFAHDNAPIFEIPNPNLPDIAGVRSIEGVGTVIFYNPALCAKAGQELCEFFRMHEYGHIAMGHLTVSNPDQETRKREEAEADRWAAKNAPTYAVKAAHRHFQSGGGETPVHGTGRERATRIALFARIHAATAARSQSAKASVQSVSAETSSSRAAGLRPAP